MNDEFLWLTAAGVTALAQREGLDESQERVVEAALEGLDSAFEARARGLSVEGRFVGTTPYPKRLWYPWILVDVAGSANGAPVHSTAPPGPGLFITDREDPPPCEGEIFIVPKGPGSDLAKYQVVRGLLRALVASRLFLVNAGWAALLPAEVGRHDWATFVVDPGTLKGSFSSSAKSATAHAHPDVLRQLGSGSALPAALEEAAEREAQVLSGARALLATSWPRELMREGWNAGYQGTFLPATLPVVDVFLIPALRSVMQVLRGPESEREVRFEDLPRARDTRHPRRVAFGCLHLLGDTINVTPCLRAFRAQEPDAHVTLFLPDKPFAQVFRLCPEVDRLAFVPTTAQQLYDQSSEEVLEAVPEWNAGFDLQQVFDVQAAAAAGTDRSMAHAYADQMGIELPDRTPSLDAEEAARHCPVTVPSRPWVVFARHTISGGPRIFRGSPTKDWIEDRWRVLAGRVAKELGLSVVCTGLPGEAPLEARGVRNLYGLSVLELAGVVSRARALVTIDNGVFHLGAALRTPIVHLCPAWLPETWTRTTDTVPHRYLHGDLARLTTRSVLEALADLLASPEARAAEEAAALRS